VIKQYRTAVALEAVWQVWHTNLKFGHTNLMKFGQSILTKIIKIGGTRCQILRLKCTKIDFGWGSAPDPAGRAYSAPPDPLAGIKETYF